MNKSKIPCGENVLLIWRDKDGNIKPLFKLNKLGRFINSMMGFKFPKFNFLGDYVNELALSNLVVNTGMATTAALINGVGSKDPFTYIAIGTGSTAAAAADTTLETEITTGGGERGAATTSIVTTDVANDTARLLLLFTFTASLAVAEAGVFNAAANGDMMSRNLFSAVNAESGDTLEITWDFQVT